MLSEGILVEMKLSFLNYSSSQLGSVQRILARVSLKKIQLSKILCLILWPRASSGFRSLKLLSFGREEIVCVSSVISALSPKKSMFIMMIIILI